MMPRGRHEACQSKYLSQIACSLPQQRDFIPLQSCLEHFNPAEYERGAFAMCSASRFLFHFRCRCRVAGMMHFHGA